MLIITIKLSYNHYFISFIKINSAYHYKIPLSNKILL